LSKKYVWVSATQGPYLIWQLSFVTSVC